MALLEALSEANQLKAKADAKQAEANRIAAEAQEKQLKAEQSAAPLRAEGGQAAIPYAEGLSQSAPAPQPMPQEAIREPASAVVPPTSMESIQSGLNAQAGVESQLGKENQAAIQQAESARMAEENSIAAKQAEIQKNINDKISQIESTKIEPQGFWEKRSTGQKIAAGIGMFFAALTPQGAQTAVGLIQKEIDQDIALQEKNLDKQKNLLSQFQKQLGDTEAAKSALRLKSLQDIELKLKANAEKFRGPLAQSKNQIAMAQLKAAQDSERQKLALEMFKTQSKQSGKAVTVGQYNFQAPTEQEASKFREAYADYNRGKTAVNELLKLQKTGSKLSLEDSAKAETLARTLKGAIRAEILGPGTVSESDQKILDNIVANPLEWNSLPSTSKMRLVTLLGTMQKSIDAKAESLGWSNPASKFSEFKR